MLASTTFGNNESSLSNYKRGVDANPLVVDLKVSNLPPECDEASLKKASGSRQVVATQIDFDNLKGTCKGSARI